MVKTSYIGAVTDARDTGNGGWTWYPTSAEFGSGAPCNAVQYQ